MIEVPFKLALRCEIVELKQKGKPCKIITTQHRSPLGEKDRWGLCTPLILLLSCYTVFSFFGTLVILISLDHKVYKVSKESSLQRGAFGHQNASISSKFGRVSPCFISNLEKKTKTNRDKMHQKTL